MQSYFDVSNFISKLIFYPNFLLEFFLPDFVLRFRGFFRGEIFWPNFFRPKFYFSYQILINWLIRRVQFGRIRASGGDRWDTMRDTWKIRPRTAGYRRKFQKLRICGFWDQDMNLNLSRQFFQNAKIRNRFPLYQNIHSKKSSDPEVPNSKSSIFRVKISKIFEFRILKVCKFHFLSFRIPVNTPLASLRL